MLCVVYFSAFAIGFALGAFVAVLTRRGVAASQEKMEWRLVRR